MHVEPAPTAGITKPSTGDSLSVRRNERPSLLCNGTTLVLSQRISIILLLIVAFMNQLANFAIRCQCAIGSRGLAAIPREIIEAAPVDGASALQRFRHLVLPLLGPAITDNAAISIVGGVAVRPAPVCVPVRRAGLRHDRARHGPRRGSSIRPAVSSSGNCRSTRRCETLGCGPHPGASAASTSGSRCRLRSSCSRRSSAGCRPTARRPVMSKLAGLQGGLPPIPIAGFQADPAVTEFVAFREAGTDGAVHGPVHAECKGLAGALHGGAGAARSKDHRPRCTGHDGRGLSGITVIRGQGQAPRSPWPLSGSSESSNMAGCRPSAGRLGRPHDEEKSAVSSCSPATDRRTGSARGRRRSRCPCRGPRTGRPHSQGPGWPR